MKGVVDAFNEQKNQQVVKPIYLYSIQYDEVGNNWLRFTSWPTEITFDGETYTPYAVTHSSMGENLSGRIERVNLNLGNVSREMQSYLENYDGLRQKKVLIKLVWEDELSNPNCYLEDTFYVEDSSSTQDTIMLTLGAAMDVMDIKLPRRSFFRGYCMFSFKGSACGYSGSETSCNKTMQRCEELGNVSRFGGFPGIPMKRLFIQ